MSNLRLIARLDIKGPNLVKTVQLEGLRIIGDPQKHANKYFDEGADELIYMDVVASLYGRNNLEEIVRHTARDVFIPITVGGGLRSVADVRKMLLAGADKVAINTAALERPALIAEVAEQFGSQCMVLSVEAKQTGTGRWECYSNNGREATGMDVLKWVTIGQRLGAGELLLTSIDNEGTRKGFDIELVRTVNSAVSIPVIASGGMGRIEHLVQLVRDTGVSGLAMADILHFGRRSIAEIRAGAASAGISVRTYP